MSLLCKLGRHAERHLWGVTPSPTKESVPKWFWQCPRCEDRKFSSSPRKFVAIA